MHNNTLESVMQILNNRNYRSAWNKGVNNYAIDLVSDLDNLIGDGYFSADSLTDSKAVESAMLNGASGWNQYSWGGGALIYDGDIAKTLCTPSELKKTRNGDRRPNSREEWLDVQARALSQACNRVNKAIRLVIDSTKK